MTRDSNTTRSGDEESPDVHTIPPPLFPADHADFLEFIDRLILEAMLPTPVPRVRSTFDEHLIETV